MGAGLMQAAEDFLVMTVPYVLLTVAIVLFAACILATVLRRL